MIFNLFSKNKERKKNTLNITSLIDVLLILLGFFILLLSEENKKHLRYFYIKLPTAHQKTQSKEKNTFNYQQIPSLMIDRQGALEWFFQDSAGHKKHIKNSDFTFVFQQHFANVPENFVIMADRDTPFGLVMDYQNLLKKQNVQNIGFCFLEDTQD